MILTNNYSKCYFVCSQCQVSQSWPETPWKTIGKGDLVACTSCRAEFEVNSISSDQLQISPIQKPREMAARK